MIVILLDSDNEFSIYQTDDLHSPCYRYFNNFHNPYYFKALPTDIVNGRFDGHAYESTNSIHALTTDDDPDVSFTLITTCSSLADYAHFISNHPELLL